MRISTSAALIDDVETMLHFRQVCFFVFFFCDEASLFSPRQRRRGEQQVLPPKKRPKFREFEWIDGEIFATVLDHNDPI